MAYDKKSFKDSVSYYKRQLKKAGCKDILIVIEYLNRKAYLSVAPLSAAAHSLGIDIFVHVRQESDKTLETLFRCYAAYEEQLPEMKAFLKATKKSSGHDFSYLFKIPQLIIYSVRNKFETNVQGIYLDYKTSWHKGKAKPRLQKTASVIWDQVMNLRKTERVGIGFELIPHKREIPLEHYLDSYFIAMAMAQSAFNYTGKVSMNASSPRESMMDNSEKVTDLLATLKGCEYSKDINEPVFRRFRALSPIIGADKLKPASAVFGLKAKGYPGRHFFGEKIGYPTPNKKTRWQSPGQMFYKLDFFPQSREDSRPPKSRICFTETLPIDTFIETNLIDWKTLTRRNKKIADVMQGSEYVLIKGKKVRGGMTDFRVNLVKKDSSHREVKQSDVETRNLINKGYYKKTGIKAGTMANLPGGEAFVTPEYVKGTIVGDVVINIDRSYKLTKTQPLVLKVDGDYKVVSGPKKLKDKLKKQKQDAWVRLLQMKKNLPKKLFEMKKSNFNNIGEFAVNTNPTAKLCDYLIVNEKIANMIHVALGSGFEDDRATEYHYDIVIDAPRQELDIYGVDKKGKERWILKKGRFVV